MKRALDIIRPLQIIRPVLREKQNGTLEVAGLEVTTTGDAIENMTGTEHPARDGRPRDALRFAKGVSEADQANPQRVRSFDGGTACHAAGLYGFKSGSSRDLNPLTQDRRQEYTDMDMQDSDNRTLRTRVAARIADLNMSMRDASIRAGMAPDTLGKFLTGRNRTMRADNLASLAKVLDTSESWLMGSNDDDRPHGAPFGVPLGGTVEAGAFRIQDMTNEDTERVPMPHDWRYPPTEQAAYRVVGDSMNRANITDGMYILAVNLPTWERLHGEPRDGTMVIVSRKREGARERELSVKRLRITRDKTTVEPDSTNPKHEAFVLTLPTEAGQAIGTYFSEVIAVCLQATLLLG